MESKKIVIARVMTVFFEYCIISYWQLVTSFYCQFQFQNICKSNTFRKFPLIPSECGGKGGI